MADLIKPRVVTIANKDGDEKEFTISRLPATVAREVVAKYPIAALPKLGDYQTSEATMLLMMRYVAVDIGGREQCLTTKALVDNHVDDVVQLLKLEFEMLRENTNFFPNEKGSGFLDYLLNRLIQSATPVLTRLLGALSAQDSQHTRN